MLDHVNVIDHPHTNEFSRTYVWKVMFSFSIISFSHILKARVIKKSFRKYSFKKRKGDFSFITNVSGEIMSFPSYPAHDKSSEEIMLKIN